MWLKFHFAACVLEGIKAGATRMRTPSLMEKSAFISLCKNPYNSGLRSKMGFPGIKV